MASITEKRGDDDDCTIESIMKENEEALRQCQAHHVNYIYINQEYRIDLQF